MNITNLKDTVANALKKKEVNGSQNCSKELIQTIEDNFDPKLSIRNYLAQTHIMALILSQESASNAAHFSEVLTRLSKRNLQNIQPRYLDIVRYKGRVNPKMPNKDSRYHLYSLKMLH